MRFLVPLLIAILGFVVSAQTDPATETPVDPSQPPVAAPSDPPANEPISPEPEPEPVLEPAPMVEPAPPPSVPAPVKPPVKPAVKPPAPPKPAPKPATTKPATPKPTVKPAPLQPFTLRLETSDQRIKSGELEVIPISRQYPLNAKSIKRSLELGKLTANLQAAVAEIARGLTRKPVNATWNFEAGNWIARDQIGWTVDQTATTTNLWAAIKAGKTSSQIVLKRGFPARNVQDWYAKGIRYHFGGGDSSFRGSPPFRVQNIIAGSRQLDERYIQPGQVFDFNANVKISEELGFVKGFIISNGTLAKDIGGGICQVSTTLFRAVYNSGLPIVQRNYHSYRVHYYDPPGFEATVFAPYKNLKFKNDTGSTLYLQVTWYTRSQRLEMQFFGPKPDRSVSISKPFIFNVREPAPARVQPDERVPLGRMWRIDSPERGMNVNIYRTVKMNSGEVRKDVTFSSYVPWGAIYGVNPNDPRIIGAKGPVPLSAFGQPRQGGTRRTANQAAPVVRR